MSTTWRELCEQLPANTSLHELGLTIDGLRGLDEDERAALWLYAWSREERDRRGASRRSARA